MAKFNRARIFGKGLTVSDINFVWDPIGYKAMQNQAAIHTYMKARAEVLATEMRRLTAGPTRSSEQYRNDRFSHSYPIGSSRNQNLHKSIESRGPIAVGTKDIPFSYNVGPHGYRGPGNLSGSENIEFQRFGTSKQNGRDFIADAVRNTLGTSLD